VFLFSLKKNQGTSGVPKPEKIKWPFCSRKKVIFLNKKKGMERGSKKPVTGVLYITNTCFLTDLWSFLFREMGCFPSKKRLSQFSSIQKKSLSKKHLYQKNIFIKKTSFF